MSSKLSIGYQLFSAREEAQKDLFGTLENIKEYGYDGVEFAGFFGQTAKELRHAMKDIGLKPFSSHVPFRQILEDPNAVIEYHQELGAHYIAIPYLEEDCRPGTPKFASVLSTIYRFGRKCKKADLTLLYHNHDFEFVGLSGQTALDFLYDAIPEDLLSAEIDTCWARYAGLDPAAYLEKYAGHCPVVHLKDFEGVREGNPAYALGALPKADPPRDVPFCFKPVGYGCQNVRSLIDAARKIGAKWVVVEQDQSTERPPLEAARLSIDTIGAILRD